ncbi:MAG: hypothetical protein M1453_14430 [Acidobacteria bacterium]|nr:hypothetical protein [Acidobacteriota bacterium]
MASLKKFRAKLWLWIVLLVIFASTAAKVGPTALSPQKFSDFTTSTPIPEGDTLVIGFLGGWEKWNEPKRGVRKFAMRLRAKNLPGVHIETAENHRREIALELVKKAFDRDADGTLSEAEAASARLIVFGQSFGGAAVNKLCKELKPLGVPVLLAVQIDSVGVDDAEVPSNVRRAANFFQRDDYFFIRGERQLRAEDATRTEILGNYRLKYRGKKIDLSDGRWYQKIFRNAHVKMEQDPDLWAKVEELILAQIQEQKIEKGK